MDTPVAFRSPGAALIASLLAHALALSIPLTAVSARHTSARPHLALLGAAPAVAVTDPRATTAVQLPQVAAPQPGPPVAEQSAAAAAEPPAVHADPDTSRATAAAAADPQPAPAGSFAPPPMAAMAPQDGLRHAMLMAHLAAQRAARAGAAALAQAAIVQALQETLQTPAADARPPSIECVFTGNLEIHCTPEAGAATRGLLGRLLELRQAAQQQGLGIDAEPVTVAAPDTVLRLSAMP
jgi:hypothetical protein